MTKNDIDSEKLQKASENQFKKFCDKGNLPWLYVSQDKVGNFSRALYMAEGKRPDFLVTIPNLGTVFFEVKAKENKLFYESVYKRSVPGFRMDTEDFKKLEKLQDQTTINVWYTIFPHLKNELTGYCFVAPLNVISKYVIWEHLTNPRWTYIQVPQQCFNDCTKIKKIDLKVQCDECTRQICKEYQNKIEPLLKGNLK